MTLSARDESLLSIGFCPDCSSPLLPGPRGGAAQNFYCTNRDNCRAGFNLTFHNGLLVFAQRIGEVARETYAMYVEAE
jgi:hypothetical protein